MWNITILGQKSWAVTLKSTRSQQKICLQIYSPKGWIKPRLKAWGPNWWVGKCVKRVTRANRREGVKGKTHPRESACFGFVEIVSSEFWVLYARTHTPYHSSRFSLNKYANSSNEKTSRNQDQCHVFIRTKNVITSTYIHDIYNTCLTWESFFEFSCCFHILTIECMSNNLTFTLGIIPKDRCDWMSTSCKKGKFGLLLFMF